MARLANILDVPHFCLLLQDDDAHVLHRIILMTGPVMMAMIATPALSAWYADGDGREPHFFYLPLGPIQGEEIVTDVNRAVLRYVHENLKKFNDMHDAVEEVMVRDG